MSGKEMMPSLQDKADKLFNSQNRNWPLFSDNHEKFELAPSKEFLFDNCFWKAGKTLLNYRKASLSANLDSIARGERACFLCKSARPSEQDAVDWGDYEILVNPYPADYIHFTIVNKEHVQQSLGSRIHDMVQLARKLYEMAIFYNGPKCGASAPDHMHFQAVDYIGADNFNIKDEYLIKHTAIGKSSIYIPRPNMSPFGYFILDIRSDNDIIPMYEAVTGLLPKDDDSSEPMMNVVAFRKNAEVTRVVIIPRKRHRPECYGTAEGQMLVSPASLEMMGRFITSRIEDYNRLDEKTMTAIYAEVAYTHDEFQELIKRLPK